MPHRRRSAFFVIDGGDGSGKDVQARLLDEYLENSGYCHLVWLTKEPRDTQEGGVIRQILRKEIAKPSARELQCFWYAEDRRRHQKEIKHHLREGRIVLCVRYYYSSLAYGMADGVSFSELWNVNKDFLKPDKAFWLDVPAEEVLRRIERSRSELELFEKLQFQERVREGYLKLFQRSDIFPEIIQIDGSCEPEVVARRIQVEVAKSLRLPVHEEKIYHITSTLRR